MHKRRAGRAKLYIVSLLLLPTLTVTTLPAMAQTPAPAAPSEPDYTAFISPLPPSVVPPRLAAPHPCTFSRAAIREHPVRPAIVTFTVTAHGDVTNTAVARSSGSAMVDDAARACVSEWVYAPAIRDGRPVAVPWATQIGLIITTGSGTGQPPPGVAQKPFVMMPVLQYRATVLGSTGCEEWHRDAVHGVLVAYDVEPDGSVKNASVVQSSGDAAEDSDALACVSRRTYKPATRDGTPVEIRLTAELFAGERE